MRGGAFLNGKEGRVGFRKLSLWLKGDGGIRKNIKEIERLNNDNTNHNHGRRRRQPLLAYVNPRLPKAIHRCDGCGGVPSYNLQ